MTNGDKYKLTKKQREMAEMLASPEFTGTVTALCRQVGVSRKCFYSWMDKEDFRAYLTELIDKYADSELATVWKALIKRCAIGDVQAIKLYFDVRSRAEADRRVQKGQASQLYAALEDES